MAERGILAEESFKNRAAAIACLNVAMNCK